MSKHKGIILSNGRQIGVQPEEVTEGVAVRFWPSANHPGEWFDSVCRSEPWKTGSGDWLVSLRGKAGGQSLDFMVLAADADGGGE